MVSSSPSSSSSSDEDVAAAAAPTDIPTQPATPPPPRKSHCVTVCAVPPPSATEAWEALTAARRQLRDPGFYRWPPHANLLYPFLELASMKKRRGDNDDGSKEEEGALFDEDMLDALQRAVVRCEPFEVQIDTFGTFGGRSRGVLWAYPRSYPLNDSCEEDGEGANMEASESGGGDEQMESLCDPSEPLIVLQSYLSDEFPTCTEQRKNQVFHPHITLSHFANANDAEEAKIKIEEWWQPIVYTMSEAYVLRRVGDGGQFEIAATLMLGKQPLQSETQEKKGRRRSNIQVHDPPIPFPAMPQTEDDWVHDERMKLKARRNGGRGRRRGGRKQRNGTERRQQPPRVRDTPEVIEAKRAARRAKREALEKAAQRGVKRVDDVMDALDESPI